MIKSLFDFVVVDSGIFASLGLDIFDFDSAFDSEFDFEFGLDTFYLQVGLQRNYSMCFVVEMRFERRYLRSNHFWSENYFLFDFHS